MVSSVDPSTGSIGPAIDATPNLSPRIEDGTAIQYGKFIYVVGFDQYFAAINLWKFSITGTRGELGDYSLLTIQGAYPMVDRKHGRIYASGVLTEPGGAEIFQLISYGVDPGTGNWRIGSSFTEKPTSGSFLRPAIDPLGRFIYEIAFTPEGGEIFVYLIDPATGNLAEAAGSPFVIVPPSISASAAHLLPSPSGNFLYASLFGSVSLGSPQMNDFYALSVDPVTGALAPIPGSPFAIDSNVDTAFAIDPAGNALFAQASVPNSGFMLHTFSLDPVSGKVETTPSATFPFTGTFFGDSMVDPSGKVLILANQFAGDVTVYSFAMTTTGALTPASGSPFSLAGTGPGSYGQFQSYLIAKVP